MKTSLDLIVAGHMVADVIGRPVFLDQPIGHGKLYLSDAIELHTGGNVCNVGVAAAKLGLRVGALGRIGDDSWRTCVLDRLESAGLDLGGVIVDKRGQTSATVVCVDPNGERSFFHTGGCGNQLTAADIIARLSYIRRARAVALGYFGLMPRLESEFGRALHAIRRAAPKTLTVLDCVAGAKGFDNLAKALPWLDIFVPSLDEARSVSGQDAPEKIIACFRAAGAPGVVGVKLGADGCLLSDGAKPSKTIHVPPVRVKKVVDATGAGDSWLAGFITARLRGFALRDAGIFANAVGACCVQAIGASTGIRPFNETLKLAQRHGCNC
ncbi:MAG: carbohydrate kinase family protein [Verrucomicrobia bacterium]|nr:carbohydrate kinase family protein [Verrucomicrobiota bacterium]